MVCQANKFSKTLIAIVHIIMSSNIIAMLFYSVPLTF